MYPLSSVQRVRLSDEEVEWTKDVPGYCPEYYDSPVLEGKVWADPAEPANLVDKYNTLDGKVNRQSHCGTYQVMNGVYPLNPYGRTGLKGRGLLGRWGPNHAADPIVSRWKRGEAGKVLYNSSSGLKILQICIIQRQDCGEMALPGGMVDPGEAVSQTLKREFTEEALNSKDSKESQQILDDFFSSENGVEVYKNYVDDPRNTDNAWMETVAVNFHDETGDRVGLWELCAGDDAAHVQWMDMDKNLPFYANHKQFIEEVVRRLGGHW